MTPIAMKAASVNRTPRVLSWSYAFEIFHAIVSLVAILVVDNRLPGCRWRQKCFRNQCVNVARHGILLPRDAHLHLQVSPRRETRGHHLANGRITTSFTATHMTVIGYLESTAYTLRKNRAPAGVARHG